MAAAASGPVPDAPLTLVLRQAAAIEVRVRQSRSGAPLPDAAVWVRYGAPEEGLAAFERTDEHGIARLEFPPGPVGWVDVVLDGHRSASSQPVRGQSPLRGVPSVIAAGEAERLDVFLDPDESRAVQGTVVGGDGKPVAGVEVREFPWTTSDSVVAVTDADGAFVARIRPDVWGRGYRVDGAGLRNAPAHGGPVRSEDGTLSLSLRVGVPTVVRGRVTSGGRPVSAALVRWELGRFPTFQTKAEMDLLAIATDEQGRFVLTLEQWESTREGKLFLRARGFRDTRSESFVPAPGRTTDVGDVVLDRGRTLEGVVLDPRGRPAAGARMRVKSGFQDSLTTTGPDGRFRLEGMGDDPPEVHAYPRRPDERAGFALASPTPESSFEVTIALVQGATCEGTALVEDGRPAVGAVVYWLRDADDDPSRAPSTHCGPDGFFRVPHLPLGPGIVWIADGDCHARRDLSLPLRDSLSVRLERGEAPFSFAKSPFDWRMPPEPPADDSAW
jgi:hypothetical protein